MNPTARLPPNFTPKTTPMQHQVDAVEFVRLSNEVPLFDEQGLGKTKIVIDAIAANIRDNLIDGAIVVCKKSLIDTWATEISKHSHLSFAKLHGTMRDRGMAVTVWAHFYVTSYETLTSEKERVKSLLRSARLALVLDESHRIKNPNGIASRTLFELGRYSPKRIILSGTPIANSPQDVWSQFYFLDEGRTFGRDFPSFKSKYCPKPYRMGLDSNDLRKLEALKAKLMSVSMRRLKNNVLELPEKVFEVVPVKLTGEQFVIYDRLRKEFTLEFGQMDGSIVLREIDNILEKMLRLVQVASNPSLVNPSSRIQPSKIPVTVGLVDSIVGRGEKAIIWTSFVENIAKLKSVFEHLAPIVIHGGVPIEKRNEGIKRFQTNTNVSLMIANPAAAREGLTLTSANHAIYYDRNFNLVDYLQSQDRIHRISQARTCFIHKLVAINTIDEYIDEIIERKANVASYVQGDVESREIIESFTKDDIMRYIGG
jgi:SNF2 family DNA or RNA helicase